MTDLNARLVSLSERFISVADEYKQRADEAEKKGEMNRALANMVAANLSLSLSKAILQEVTGQ